MGIYRPNVYKVRHFLLCPILDPNSSTSQTLRNYLQEEHMDKKKKPFDFSGWVDHYDEVR
jgi:hypothetical protein